MTDLTLSTQPVDGNKPDAPSVPHIETENKSENPINPQPTEAQEKKENSDESAPAEQPAPPKRKRGRPRKEEVAKRPKPEIHDDEQLLHRRERRAVVQKRQEERKRMEEELERENRLNKERRKRNRGETASPRPAMSPSFKREDSEETQDNGHDNGHDNIVIDPLLMEEMQQQHQQQQQQQQDQGPVGEPDDKPKKKGRPRKNPLPEETADAESPEPKPFARPSQLGNEAAERRTKKGRPSKQEKVTGQVSSIFHMDDIAFSPQKSDSKDQGEKPEKPNMGSLNFDNTGESSYSAVPVISGLLSQKPAEKPQGHDGAAHFEPLPVPDLDEHGNVKDPEYIKQYFPDAHLNGSQEDRLTDDRAFFLEGSEGYFEQHSLRFRPSSSALALKAPQLDYSEFIPMVKLGSLLHRKEREALYELHKKLYHQFCFELSQGYNLNFFGVGLKVELINDFVESYLLDWIEDTVSKEMPKVMVINGYNSAVKLKTIIQDIANAIVTPEIRKQNNLKMPKHVSEAFPFLMSYMKRSRQTEENGIVRPRLLLVIHSIDGEAFRDERSQNILSQLASLPDVWLITSVDNINASLLWDLYRFKNFNFLWHDATTYEPYTVERSFKDVLSMGRSKKFGGVVRAKYVLSSLSDNAKKLYSILLKLQLDKMKATSKNPGIRGSAKLAIDFTKLYDESVQEYVTSNEMNMRSMLQEYVEHKMCVLHKDPQGKEVVYVPFLVEEVEALVNLATEGK